MTAPIKVPADLLDADMLYQRDAVLHAGMASVGPLTHPRRRVLHAVLSAAEGEVVAAEGDGCDVLSAAMATSVVSRAVADVEPARVVVVCPSGVGDFPEREPAESSFVERRWLPDDADAACELTFLATAADYLGRDIAEVDLKTARMGLRGRLDRINSARMILINVVASGGDQMSVGLQVDRLAQLCGFGENQEERLLRASRGLRSVDEALDPIRRREYWLAVHVQECAWLELAREGRTEAPLQLVERVGVDHLADATADDKPIELLGVLDGGLVEWEGVRPLAERARRTFVAGSMSEAGDSSALTEALAACRWDFPAGDTGGAR